MMKMKNFVLFAYGRSNKKRLWVNLEEVQFFEELGDLTAVYFRNGQRRDLPTQDWKRFVNDESRSES